MKTAPFTAFLFAIAALNACSPDAHTKAGRERALAAFRVIDAKNARLLERIKIDTAVADADKALRRGDGRVLGVVGFSSVPGEGNRSSARSCGVRIIKGTSDVVSDRTMALNLRARGYATAYNARINERTGCQNER
jgi:hypothetical protein